MKKLVCVFLLCVSVLVACGEENPPERQGILTIDPSEYYFVQEFDLPQEDFRSAAVNHMRKQASIQWVCGKDFAVDESFQSWGIRLHFRQGETYTGIPFADTKVSYTQFENCLVDGTLMVDSAKWKELYGVQCVSSIMNAVQQFDPYVAGWSTELMPSYDSFQGVIVGEYTIPKGAKRTKDILDANSEKRIYGAYSQLQKGDIIITKDDVKDASHLRMLVQDPTLVYDAYGNIDPAQSYVTTIEQTNQFDKTRTDGVKTTWWVDHQYSFETLLATNYLPVTLESYSLEKSQCQVPYILLDAELIPDQIATGKAMNNVKSNFPIRYVNFHVFDSAGTLIKHVKAYDLANVYTVSFRKYSPIIVEGLAPGDYRLVLTAGIALGDAELQQVEFTIQK